MDEYQTEKTVYSPEDLVVFKEKGMLEITPKFQRRPVWRTPAKAFLIDTILRGMTVPPLYFRRTQNKDKTKIVREVVDGQQRVRSVLEFIAGEYRLSKNFKASWAGMSFDGLSPEQRDQIMSFSFSAEIFKSISDAQVLEVFCRLNMNGIPLNRQELRNGKFFGKFKQTALDLSLSYLEFWRKHKVFSEQNIARMLEVELTSELLIAGHSGMQDKKKSIDNFYDDWEQEYPNQDKDDKRFRETMNVVSETFPKDGLADSDFRRPPLFYTLYCVLFHHMFGLPDVQRVSPRKRLTAVERDGLREAVGGLSERIARSKDPATETPAKYRQFIAACQRQTDNILPRKVRFNTLFDEAF